MAGCVVINIAIAVLAALATSETQTLKNFGKEAEQKPRTWGQVGRGLISGYEQVSGKLKAKDANETIVNELDQYRGEAALAQSLVDAFREYDKWKALRATG